MRGMGEKHDRSERAEYAHQRAIAPRRVLAEYAVLGQHSNIQHSDGRLMEDKENNATEYQTLGVVLNLMNVFVVS